MSVERQNGRSLRQLLSTVVMVTGQIYEYIDRSHNVGARFRTAAESAVGMVTGQIY